VENTPNVKPSRGKLIDQRSVREPLSLDTRLDPLQQELLPLVVVALYRVFGIDAGMRRVQRTDFRVNPKEMQGDAPNESKLWIEADFEFEERRSTHPSRKPDEVYRRFRTPLLADPPLAQYIPASALPIGSGEHRRPFSPQDLFCFSPFLFWRTIGTATPLPKRVGKVRNGLLSLLNLCFQIDFRISWPVNGYGLRGAAHCFPTPLNLIVPRTTGVLNGSDLAASENLQAG